MAFPHYTYCFYYLFVVVVLVVVGGGVKLQVHFTEVFLIGFCFSLLEHKFCINTLPAHDFSCPFSNKLFIIGNQAHITAIVC